MNDMLEFDRDESTGGGVAEERPDTDSVFIEECVNAAGTGLERRRVTIAAAPGGGFRQCVGAWEPCGAPGFVNLFDPNNSGPAAGV